VEALCQGSHGAGAAAWIGGLPIRRGRLRRCWELSASRLQSQASHVRSVRSLPELAGHPGPEAPAEPLSLAGDRSIRERSGDHQRCCRQADGAREDVSDGQAFGAFATAAQRDSGGQALPAQPCQEGRIRRHASGRRGGPRLPGRAACCRVPTSCLLGAPGSRAARAVRPFRTTGGWATTAGQRPTATVRGGFWRSCGLAAAGSAVRRIGD